MGFHGANLSSLLLILLIVFIMFGTKYLRILSRYLTKNIGQQKNDPPLIDE